MRKTSRRTLKHRLWRWFSLNLALAAFFIALSGRPGYLPFQLYFGLWLAATLCGTILIDPDLQQERIHPGPGGQDYLLRNLTIPLLAAHWAVAALDVGRLHLTPTLPWWLHTGGFLLFAGGLALWHWALLVNPFYSSVVRHQPERGHHTIRHGPYRLVRHPGYAGGIAVLLGGGLALGSLLALLPAALLIGLIIRRIPREEALLRTQLPDYAAYSAATRSRLLPFVW